MSEQRPYRYFTSEQWAHVIAHSWLNVEFAEQLEKDPRDAIASFYDEVVCSKTVSFSDCEVPISQVNLFSLPDRSKIYSVQQLEDGLLGKLPIIPIAAMMLPGKENPGPGGEKQQS